MSNRLNKYSNFIPSEIKNLIIDAPKDDIDWALIIYLYGNSTEHYGYSAFYKEPRNVITVGKVAKYFDLDYNDVYKRLNRMVWWVSLGTVYGYYKPVSVCDMTIMGIKAIDKLMQSMTIDETEL